MEKKFLFIIGIFSLINIFSFSSAGFGIDNENIPSLRPESDVSNIINYINEINNTQYFQGYTPSSLYNYYKDLFDLVYCAIGDCGGGTSNTNDGTASGQMLFWDNSSQTWNNTETSEMFWDDTNKRLGIGTATPSNRLTIKQNADIDGIRLYGYDDVSSQYLHLYINGAGSANAQASGDLYYTIAGQMGFSTGPAKHMYIDLGGNLYLRDVDSALTKRGVWRSDNGYLGIGTDTPTNGKVDINGSVSGISLYASNNISAEDYLYHSPFPSKEYTDNQALQDLIKINGDGEINHSTIPTNALSTIEKPIYEYENKTSEEEKCIFDKKLFSNKYTKECYNKTIETEVIKQNCVNETQIEYKEIEGKSDTFEKIETQVEKCENIINNYETEPQTSIGMMIGNIIKSIREIYNWNTEQDAEIQMLKTELCNKDNTYKFCSEMIK